jgi:hypothetical protein
MAADDEPVRERWGVSAGTFLIRNADTTIRLDAANGLIGTTINFKRLGFGFGLQRFDFNLEATKDKFSGSFENRWDGIYLYLMGYSL